VGDIAALPPGALERYLGEALGAHLATLARGDDQRPVVADQPAKSIGHEETFASDIWDRGRLHGHLMRMVDASATSLRAADLAARTISIKIKFADFSQITRSHSMSTPIDASPAIHAVAGALLDSVDLNKGVRLLGVSLTGFGSAAEGLQLSFDLGPPPATADDPRADPLDGGADSAAPDPARDPAASLDRAGQEAERIQQSWGSVTAAVDAIRARYGGSSVGPASLVGPDGLRIRRRGTAQWGPAGIDVAPRDDDRPTTL
jgi:hypothetical protein